LRRNAEIPDHPSVYPDSLQVVDPSAADRVLPARIQLDELDRCVVFLEKERALQTGLCVPLKHLSAFKRNHAIVKLMRRQVLRDDPCLPLEHLPRAEVTNDLLGRFEEPDRRKARVAGQPGDLLHDRTSQLDLVG
jgi:hypothetical protein